MTAVTAAGTSEITPPEQDRPDWKQASGLADEAIGLFLEYRDRHGHDEESARRSAVLEVAEGASVTDAEIGLTGPGEQDEPEPPARVRWETGPTGNLLGYVGTLPFWCFQIFPSGIPEEGRKLVPNLPGTGTVIARSADLGELKEQAEEYLVGFIAAAGARFSEAATTGEG